VLSPSQVYLRIGCGGEGNGSHKNEQEIVALRTS
jgi:hypothetical protein